MCHYQGLPCRCGRYLIHGILHCKWHFWWQLHYLLSQHHPIIHELSDVGKDAAVAHGQKISEYQLPDGITLLMEEDDTGLTHVWDAWSSCCPLFRGWNHFLKRSSRQVEISLWLLTRITRSNFLLVDTINAQQQQQRRQRTALDDETGCKLSDHTYIYFVRRWCGSSSYKGGIVHRTEEYHEQSKT